MLVQKFDSLVDKMLHYVTYILFFSQQLLVVVNELESLKEEVYRQVDRLNKSHTRSQEYQPNGLEGTPHRSGASSFQLPAVNNSVSFGSDNKQVIIFVFKFS